MGFLAVLAVIAMVGMYAYWFYTDFIRKRIQKKKAAEAAAKQSADDIHN